MNVALPADRHIYFEASPEEWDDHLWQERNSVTKFEQLEALLGPSVPQSLLDEIRIGIGRVGMSIRITPHILSLIDWHACESDPLRRQFLPLASELEDDHPCLSVDSLDERETSPVPGLVHRYPDKVLFLATSACPVYCQYCTRSYAVGQDTQLLQKDHVASTQNWQGAIDYIRDHPQIEDVVISGGDIARLKPAAIMKLGQSLLEIEHVHRIRLATKAVSVLPMKFFSDEPWFRAVADLVAFGRTRFKDVCLHTHFNHPREVTPASERAMRRLHEAGVFVRNQAVLLRGVNDRAETLIQLIRKLGRINIHPYYLYLCDMVVGTEHFRLPLRVARELEKQIRGSTAGFNTPLFVVDLPGGGGKRDVHSCEFQDERYGVSAFRSPAVDEDRLYFYFDPVRSLDDGAGLAWKSPHARRQILTELGVSLHRRRARQEGAIA